MATERNFYVEANKDGSLFEKPLLVTIALEEHRSLIVENLKLKTEVSNLYDEHSKLKQKGCCKNE